ncbi:MAG: NAD-binding protein [Planctomycetes bacterium]|nr:NAD-binding protein [Planctomycetota bacterium]
MILARQSRRILQGLLLLALLIGAGGLGYVLIEGWSFGDGLYMTVITVTTIGYGEVRPLSSAGRWWTVLVVLVGIGVVLRTSATLLYGAVEQGLHEGLRRRRLRTMIRDWTGHSIVCGYGKIGTAIASELKAAHQSFVIVERSEAVCKLAEDDGHAVVHGDATEEEALRQAGVEKARALFAALHDDAENVFCILTARELSPQLTILARASVASSVKKLRRAGASYVTCPNQIGGQRLVRYLLHPSLVNLLETASAQSGTELSFDEVKLLPGSRAAGKSLRDLDLKSRFDLLVIAISPPSGPPLFNPPSDRALAAGERLLVMGKRERIAKWLAELDTAAP